MNKPSWLLPAFALVVAAQLAVLASMIIGHELTLRDGLMFKFRTEPVDPADAFRGRYVWVNLEPDVIRLPDVDRWHPDEKAFAVLGTDTNGFAIVKRLERTAPGDEPAVQVRTSWSDVEKGDVYFRWPGLDRYYMTESKAPAAETAYWQHNRRTNQACYVTVRVRGPHAIIENLYIEDQPVNDWLRDHNDN
jgi:uncharacterized membrane-anchored protein